MAFEPASFNVSTSPMRTRVENSEPSRTTASAAVAPCLIAAATTSVAVSFRFIFKSKSTTEAQRNPSSRFRSVGPGLAEAFLTVRDRSFCGGGAFPSRHLCLLAFEFLVDLEKMFHRMQDVRIDLLHLMNIVIEGIVVGDGEDLGIALALVDHSQHADGAHFHQASGKAWHF